MNSIIILFGLIAATVGMLMLLCPRLVLHTVHVYAGERWLQVLASFNRLVLGSALLACAEQTRFPLIIQAIGMLTLISGMGVAVVSYVTFHQLVRWGLNWADRFTRVTSLFVLGFGFFLVYAMI